MLCKEHIRGAHPSLKMRDEDKAGFQVSPQFVSMAVCSKNSRRSSQQLVWVKKRINAQNQSLQKYPCTAKRIAERWPGIWPINK